MVLLDWTAKFKNLPNKEEYGEKIEPDSHTLQFIIGFIYVKHWFSSFVKGIHKWKSLNKPMPTKIYIGWDFEGLWNKYSCDNLKIKLK